MFCIILTGKACHPYIGSAVTLPGTLMHVYVHSATHICFLLIGLNMWCYSTALPMECTDPCSCVATTRRRRKMKHVIDECTLKESKNSCYMLKENLMWIRQNIISAS